MKFNTIEKNADKYWKPEGNSEIWKFGIFGNNIENSSGIPKFGIDIFGIQ